MSSMPEPLRPAYATGDSAAVTGSSSDTSKKRSASSAGKASARSRSKKTAAKSREKSSKGARSSAKRFVKAAYEPLRRAVSGGGKARAAANGGMREQPALAAHDASSEDRRSKSAAKAVASVEVIDAPRAGSAPASAPVQAQDHPAIGAEDIASVIAAAANVSTGLSVVTQSETQRLRTAEAMMRESLQKYQAAMRQMEVRLEVLDRDLSLKKNRNPIHHIESRIKKPASIFEKLQRQGFPVTIESMEENLFDIAGVRVICSYIHDVYNLLDSLKKQDDLEIVTVKDYIANPKPNGYRSLHAIVRIPVYFMDKKEMVPVEVQMRTIAMDFWASLEHSLKYKAVHEVQGIDASDELKDCSRIIEDVEARMQILARALEVED